MVTAGGYNECISKGKRKNFIIICVSTFGVAQHYLHIDHKHAILRSKTTTPATTIRDTKNTILLINGSDCCQRV